MSRSLHTAVSVVLLAVLSGAPAVVCAAWCTPTEDQATATHTDHADHARPPASVALDCHRPSSDAGTIAAHAIPACAHHAAALSRAASVIASRLEAAQLEAAGWMPSAMLEMPAASARGFISGATDAPPRHPLHSRLALRI